MPTTRLKFGEYEAWINIEDQEIEHYDVEINEETKTVTCWIASEEGKQFTICARKMHKKFGCSFRSSVDGLRIKGAPICPSKTGAVFRRGVPTPFGTLKLFEFARLEVTDDDSYIENGPTQGVGEIDVTLNRAKFVKKEARETKANVHGLSQPYKVHEKAKKAMTHRVQCSREIKESTSLFVYSATRFEIVASFKISLSVTWPMALPLGPVPPPEAQSTSALQGKRKIAPVKEEEDEPEDDDLVHTQQKVDQLLFEASRLKALLDDRQSKRPAKKKAKKAVKPAFVTGEVIDLT